MKVTVEFEFDENNLGEGWFNIDNLKLLLYGEYTTKPELLKVTKFNEKPKKVGITA